MRARIYSMKRMEEFLGFVGILYFLVLGVWIFFTIHFLAGATFDSLATTKSSAPLPPHFDFRVYDALRAASSLE